MDKCGKAVLPSEDCTCECCRCTVGVLKEYYEGLMLGGLMIDDFDLAEGDALGVQV